MNECKRRMNSNREVIQSDEIDVGSIATQKRGEPWFISLSKKRVRELGRLIQSSQIKKELLHSRSIVQINKLTKNCQLVNSQWRWIL
jgi:hypothetical protein